MTLPPSSKCFSLRKPLTRARIVTSSRARVVPIGLTTTGSVFRCAATTVTRGGAGAGPGRAVALQPQTPTATATAVPHRASSRDTRAETGRPTTSWIDLSGHAGAAETDLEGYRRRSAGVSRLRGRFGGTGSRPRAAGRTPSSPRPDPGLPQADRHGEQEEEHAPGDLIEADDDLAELVVQVRCPSVPASPPG